MSGALRVCLVGLGEVGRILAADLRPRVASLAVWDIQFPAPGSAPRDAAAALGLEVTRHAGEAITGADLVIDGGLNQFNWLHKVHGSAKAERERVFRDDD